MNIFFLFKYNTVYEAPAAWLRPAGEDANLDRRLGYWEMEKYEWKHCGKQ